MDQVFQLVLACLSTIATFLFYKAANNLEKLTESVDSLNTKIAVIVARVDSHEKRIDRIEEHVIK